MNEPGFRRKYWSRIEGHLPVAAAYSVRISDLDSIDFLVSVILHCSRRCIVVSRVVMLQCLQFSESVFLPLILFSCTFVGYSPAIMMDLMWAADTSVVVLGVWRNLWPLLMYL